VNHETPADYFTRVKYQHRDALHMLGHPVSADDGRRAERQDGERGEDQDHDHDEQESAGVEDPLAEHFRANVSDAPRAMRALGHPVLGPSTAERGPDRAMGNSNDR